MNDTQIILNGANAEHEEMELEALVHVLGNEECQRAVRHQILPVTIARVQIEE
ncbi:hypothetical protein ACGFZA_15780 [Streptomyces sp. NPDC048211]|uniref:hypothetical protein n=1 Tax=Streptomyces sp. NPDC048211 TaxID=3365516 RepID=UPI003712CC7A